MPTFSFRLQKVLEYRQALVDRLSAELASLRRSHEQAESRLADLHCAERSALSQLGARREATLDIPEMIQTAGHLDSLRGQIAEQASVVHRISQEVNAMRSDLLEGAKNARTLQRLRDRQAEEHLQEARRQDGRDAGEVTAFQLHRIRVGK
jgi:flagellar FliJ protein